MKERDELIKAVEKVLDEFHLNSSRHPVVPGLLIAMSGLHRAVVAEKDALIKNHTAQIDIEKDA